jgi:hypothetical protein
MVDFESPVPKSGWTCPPVIKTERRYTMPKKPCLVSQLELTQPAYFQANQEESNYFNLKDLVVHHGISAGSGLQNSFC